MRASRWAEAWPLAALLLLGSLAFVHLTAVPVFEDEGSQMRWIFRIIEAGEWSAPLDEGKPLEAWPMVPLIRLGVPTLIAVRSLHVLAGMIAILLTYRIGRKLADCRTAFIAAALFALCPFTVYLQRFALSDGLMCASGLWVLWSSFRLLQSPSWHRSLILAASLVLAAISKFPVGFVFLLDIPLALLLMPGAQRRELCRGSARAMLLAAHVPVLLLAGLIAATAVVRTSHGLSPGFGLRDLFGVGIGQYRDIGAAMNLPRPTLHEELSTQLSWSALLLGLIGVAAAACLNDWRQRWLIALGGLPMLLIGELASFWYSRYLLFTLPPLIVAAVVGWQSLLQRFGAQRLAGWRVAIGGAALLTVVYFMGRQTILIILDPVAANWSPVDRFQYFEGWGSGYGYPEAAGFLLSTSTAPSTVFALDGHSAYQLLSYLPPAWHTRVRPIFYGSQGEVLRSAQARRANLERTSPVWLIVPQPLLQRYLESSFGHIDPVDWRPLVMFAKPGARAQLGVYRVVKQESTHE